VTDTILACFIPLHLSLPDDSPLGSESRFVRLIVHLCYKSRYHVTVRVDLHFGSSLQALGNSLVDQMRSRVPGGGQVIEIYLSRCLRNSNMSKSLPSQMCSAIGVPS